MTRLGPRSVRSPSLEIWMECEKEAESPKEVECFFDTIGRRLENISAALDFAETFFTSFSFVYDFNNIKILSEGHLRRFPEPWMKWVTHIHEKDPAFATVKTSISNPEEAPDSLPENFLHFCRQRNELRALFRQLVSHDTKFGGPDDDDDEILPELPKSLERGMGEKKAHEVARMATFVAGACRDRGVGHVIDVGSGVGHLGRVLNEVHGLAVSCLEGDAGIAERAAERKKKGGGDDVAYFNLRIGSDSARELEEIIAGSVGGGGEGGVALVGLHCCGDLSADVIRLFLSVPAVTLLALVPCCFHKASPSMASMSRSVVAGSPYVRRLAVQDSYGKWKVQTEAEHERHMRVFGFRAILEDFVRHRDISVDKKRRRGRRTDSTENFKSWLATNFVMRGEYDEEQLESDVEKYIQMLPALELITGLQQSLQDLVLTHLVLDRVTFLLKQPNVKDARVYEIFDAEISSVNKLLFCTKDN